MDAAKKNFRRFQQLANQNLGLAEKTEVISDDLHSIEERAEHLVEALIHTKQKLSECLRSRSKEENLDKRRKKLVEFQLAQTFLNDSKNLEDVLKDSVLGQILSLYGNGLYSVAEELVQSELNIERRILEHLLKYSEEYKNVTQQKEKMKKAVLDMDSVRSRLANAQNKGEKCDHLQDDLDACWNKVENYKDTWALELYSLAGKEIDMANIYFIMAKLQMDYYKTAYKTLEDLLPLIQKKIELYPRRPVYGCPLADHLRYSKREISAVFEVCCAALCELGLKEEGIFRISGSALKMRKLKAAFDVDEIDLIDMEGHPHSIAGALKLYLRELPDPLMTHNLYGEWLRAANIDDIESRLKAIKDVVNRLPEPNFVNLRYLIKFLAKVAENQHYTKMNSQNLAIVIAPNILWSPNNTDGYGDNLALGTLVDCLISNADYFFPGEIRFQSNRIASLINKTGGFMDESFCGGNGMTTSAITAPAANAPKTNVMEESCRSISPPSDDSSLGGSFTIPNQSSSYVKTTVTTTASLSRRPKQPAPPPPKSSSSPSVAAKPPTTASIAVHTQERGPEVICLDHEYSSVPMETILPLQKSPKTPPDDPVVIKSPGIPTDPQKMVPSSGATPQKPPKSPSTVDENSDNKTSAHRKTNSLDRPLKPPRGPAEPAPPATDDGAHGESSSLDRPVRNSKNRLIEEYRSQKENRNVPEDQTKQSSNNLPNRPPLPSKEKIERHSSSNVATVASVSRKSSATISSGHFGATNVEIDSTEDFGDSCDVEPISGRRGSYKCSESENEEVDPEKTTAAGEHSKKVPSVSFRRSAFEKSNNNTSTAKKELGAPAPSVAPRLSMKKLTSVLEEQVSFPNGASAGVPAPPRPKPPVPFKPRSGAEEGNTGGGGPGAENSTRL